MGLMLICHFAVMLENICLEMANVLLLPIKQSFGFNIFCNDKERE